MSGETQKDVSAWTIDSLKQHLDERLVEMDKRFEQRFLAQEKASDRAIAIGNEFRGALEDQSTHQMPRTESIALHAATAEKIAKIEQRFSDALTRINSRLDLTQGTSGGIKAAFGVLVATIAAATAIVSAVVLLAR